MILICDAPEHGVQFLADGNDRYPKGTPNSFKIEELMHEAAERQINFSVCRLDHTCDEMIITMHKHFIKRVEGEHEEGKDEQNCCIRDCLAPKEDTVFHEVDPEDDVGEMFVAEFDLIDIVTAFPDPKLKKKNNGATGFDKEARGGIPTSKSSRFETENAVRPPTAF